MIDDDWRDYVDDLKKNLMHNGIVGDYFKSTDELEEEAKKLLSIVEVINNAIEIREKVYIYIKSNLQNWCKSIKWRDQGVWEHSNNWYSIPLPH